MSEWTGPPGPPTGPPAVPYEPGGEPILLTVGDIAVTPTHVIVPHGRYPLRGTVWTVQDATQVQQGTPTYAVVLAIVGVFVVCVFSLLLLLIKERKYYGTITVAVSGPGLYYAVQYPGGPASGQMVASLVAQARALAASAPPVS